MCHVRPSGEEYASLEWDEECEEGDDEASSWDKHSASTTTTPDSRWDSWTGMTWERASGPGPAESDEACRH